MGMPPLVNWQWWYGIASDNMEQYIKKIDRLCYATKW